MPAPTGEESCDDAVAPMRSRRRRPSGRSAHHQRPLGRGLGQEIHGDQGDPEGPEGETGLAPQTMRTLSPAGLRVPPPTLLPRDDSRSTGFRSARRCLSNRRSSNARPRLGQAAGRSGLRPTAPPTNSVRKRRQGTCLGPPAPTHSRTDDRPAKACRKPKL